MRTVTKAVAALALAVLGLPGADPAPAVHTVSGKFDRVVVVRLKNKTDMLAGLEEAVKKEKIRNAVVVSGFGSLTSYHVHIVSNTTLPPTNAFIKGSGPYDLLDVSGAVFEGRVHAHITIATEKNTTGGHLEPGTSVFTFAIITLGVLDDKTDIRRFDDPAWN